MSKRIENKFIPYEGQRVYAWSIKYNDWQPATVEADLGRERYIIKFDHIDPIKTGTRRSIHRVKPFGYSGPAPIDLDGGV